MSACSDSKEFRVEGLVRGLGTRAVTIDYSVSGTLYTATTTAIDGKFFFTGTSRDYTQVQISSSNRLLGFFVIKNGETVKCELDFDNPDDMTFSGNKPSEQISAFMTDNAQIFADRDRAALDKAIENYVTTHPDRLSSALLLMNLYDSRLDPARADSLMSMIRPEARPTALTADYRLQLSDASEAQTTAKVKTFSLPSDGDTIEHFIPSRYRASLIYFRGDRNERHDTVVPLLRHLRADFTGRELHIVEVGMVNDTSRWASMVNPRDSTSWTRVFSPGGRLYTPFEALNVPRLPYFIVSDENGNQLYRGQSATKAGETASKFIRTNR